MYGYIQPHPEKIHLNKFFFNKKSTSKPTISGWYCFKLNNIQLRQILLGII